MPQLIQEIHTALAQSWKCQRQIIRTCPIVPVANNYDRLGYPKEGAARDARYSRYISEGLMLRTQTSAAIPDALAGLHLDPPEDLLLILPGIVYRRDSIDRLHCAEPHQLDLWRITNRQGAEAVTAYDLKQMIAIVMKAALPKTEWRLIDSPHPYTDQGVQIDALWNNEWIEVGECGLIAREILEAASLHRHCGLAMGLGLDRLLMIRKNISDIRLLRSTDLRIKKQLQDLAPYEPVSAMPAIARDLSICVHASTSEEEIGDRIREHITEWAAIESLQIKSETPYEKLPVSAQERMGMHKDQKNILLHLIIRHMEKTLTDGEANLIRNKVYDLLHEGSKREVALSRYRR